MGINITNILDAIPGAISWVRENIIMKLCNTLNFPNQTYMFVFLIIALVGSYYFIRQWITYSIFTKISTILNWILLAILIYVVLVYV